MKYCSKCNTDKDEACFSRNKRTSDGLQWYCKPCKAEYDKRWKQENAEHWAAYMKSYYDANPVQYAKMAARSAQYHKTQAAKDPEYYAKLYRKYRKCPSKTEPRD